MKRFTDVGDIGVLILQPLLADQGEDMAPRCRLTDSPAHRNTCHALGLSCVGSRL